MDNNVLIPNEAGTNVHTTTARREWLGWVFVMTWWFLINNIFSYIPMGFESNAVFWTNLLTKIIIMLSIAAFGWFFGRDPNGLSRVSLYTTPVAIILTVAFPFFIPSLPSSVFFALSPIFIALVFVRRLYGMIRTANPDRVL